MIYKEKNIRFEEMLTALKPLLQYRSKIGYVAARNTRIICDALKEYFDFKADLIKKYGETDRDDKGNDMGTISIKPDSSNFPSFIKDFDEIKNIEQEVELMTIGYSEIIGVLSGEEILDLDWMFTEEVKKNG